MYSERLEDYKAQYYLINITSNDMPSLEEYLIDIQKDSVNEENM